MKYKINIFIGSLIALFATIAIAHGAATSTIVNNLFINALKSTGNPCLIIGADGLVSTSTSCGTGGGGGGVATSGLPVATNIAFFTDPNTISGSSSLTYTSSTNTFGVIATSTFTGKFTQTGGIVGLASTTITGTAAVTGVTSLNGLTNNGNATTTNLTITAISGSTQCLHVSSAGVVTGTGSDCGAAAGGTGTVTTSTAVTVGYFPTWGTTSALTGTSTIFQSGLLTGIGTTQPSSTVHVVGTTTITASTTLSYISGSTQCLHVDTNGVVSGTGADCATSTSTGANPTASIGLTAVNGTANTFMRSDAAPALSQSIAPTWTGAHIFNGGLTANSTSTFNSSTIVNGQLAFGSASGTNLQVTGYGTFPTLNFTNASGSFLTLINTTTTNLTVGSLTAGSIPFAGTGGVISQNNANLFWNNTASRLGVGTSSPLAQLSIAGVSPETVTSTLVLLGSNSIQSGNVSGTFIGANPSLFNGDFVNFQVNSSTQIRITGDGRLAVGSSSVSSTLTVSGTSYVTGTSTIAGNLLVGTNVLGAVQRQAAVVGSGGMIITTSATNLAAAGGQALVIVAGTTTNKNAIFSAHSNVGATSAEKFRVNADGTVGIGTTAPAATLSINGLPPESATSTLVLLGSNVIQGGNTSGTLLSANPSSTNAFNADFINFQVNSSTKFLVSATGSVLIGNALNVTGTTNLASTLTQSGGLVSLASTTITGQATTTNLSITSITGTQCLRATNGVVSGTGSDCGSGGGTESGWRYNNPFVYLATSTSQVGIGATSTDSTFFVQSRSVGTSTAQLKGLPAQTASLFKVSSSSNNDFLDISATGTIRFLDGNSNAGLTYNTTSTGNVFEVQSSSSVPIFGVTTTSSILIAGHIVTSGTAPSLSSCGSSPSIVGNDQAGTVTAGATSNGCTVTFATAYTAAPHCAVTAQTGSLSNTFSYSISTTAITVVQTALGTGKFDYICQQ